jgi:hypothetical protein
MCSPSLSGTDCTVPTSVHAQQPVLVERRLVKYVPILKSVLILLFITCHSLIILPLQSSIFSPKMLLNSLFLTQQLSTDSYHTNCLMNFRLVCTPLPHTQCIYVFCVGATVTASSGNDISWMVSVMSTSSFLSAMNRIFVFISRIFLLERVKNLVTILK